MSLATIGWPAALSPPVLQAPEFLVRVIEQHRNGYTVHDGESAQRAVAARGLVEDAHGEPIRPSVGDWTVAVPGSPWTLLRLLPRRNVLRRAAAGESFREQVLAVNLDLAVVVMGLDGDYNPRRLERYLALIDSAEIPAILVLSKADQHSETLPERLLDIHARAGDRPVLAINCKDAGQVAAIAAELGPGRTGILLGSSGAGKSTLSNTLIGEVRQKTNEVRDHDSRGRHTTTVRSLLRLPSGGCLIDSPGMRELKLVGDEALAEGQFQDIDELAMTCRFRDCRHESEPGCAVRAAIAAGRLDGERLDSYRKLALERDVAASQRAAMARKGDEKALNRAVNPRLDEENGRH